MDHGIVVRRVAAEDEADWVRLRTALWPEWPDDHPVEIRAHLQEAPEREACFVAVVKGEVVGFAEFRLREYAEECETSPVGYLEGIFVDPSVRVRGVGRALVEAGEGWSRDRGCTEMASDRELTNEVSGAFHLAIGFDEAVRLVAYRKDL